jgi:hypothetical protein
MLIRINGNRAELSFEMALPQGVDAFIELLVRRRVRESIWNARPSPINPDALVLAKSGFR